MTNEAQINLLLELNPDATIKDYEKFKGRDIDQLAFEVKEKKAKEKADRINQKLSA